MELERRLDRFSSLDWAEYLIKLKRRGGELSVNVLGAGGIGSWTSLLLSRAGFQVKVYDFDTVEEVNAAGQLFGKSSIGLSKVEAVTRIVEEFSGLGSIYCYNRKIGVDWIPENDIVISAFDNMAARKLSFERWYQACKNKDTAIFIDGRLLAEQLTVFCVTYDKADEYRKYLFDDSEVADAPCSAKQTSHVAAMIAAYITTFLTNHVSNCLNSNRVKSVPFKFELFTPLNIMQIDD